jgi:hypothetical protein
MRFIPPCIGRNFPFQPLSTNAFENGILYLRALLKSLGLDAPDSLIGRETCFAVSKTFYPRRTAIVWRRGRLGHRNARFGRRACCIRRPAPLAYRPGFRFPALLEVRSGFRFLPLLPGYLKFPGIDFHSRFLVLIRHRIRELSLPSFIHPTVNRAGLRGQAERHQEAARHDGGQNGFGFHDISRMPAGGDARFALGAKRFAGCANPVIPKEKAAFRRLYFRWRPHGDCAQKQSRLSAARFWWRPHGDATLIRPVELVTYAKLVRRPLPEPFNFCLSPPHLVEILSE